MQRFILWALPGIPIILSAIWAIFSYIDTQRRESQKPFLDQQFKLYTEATTVAAKIAIRGPDRTRNEVQRFWELYWGELSMVESRQVEVPW